MATSSHQVRQLLQILPKGLNETYQRIRVRIGEADSQAELAKRVFQWLVCAKRPLLLEEMREAVAFDEFDAQWDGEKIPSSEIVLQSCRGLVIVDQEKGTTPFAHYTIQQFLEKDTFEIPPVKSSYAEQRAAVICVTYLNFTDFETTVVNRPTEVRFAPTGILGPGGPGTIPSVVGLGRPIFDVAYRVLGGRSRDTALDIDYSKYLKLAARKPAQKITEKYALLNYVVENWAWHTKGLRKDNTRA